MVRNIWQRVTKRIREVTKYKLIMQNQESIPTPNSAFYLFLDSIKITSALLPVELQ